jgi:hypothetical protein
MLGIDLDKCLTGEMADGSSDVGRTSVRTRGCKEPVSASAGRMGGDVG